MYNSVALLSMIIPAVTYVLLNSRILFTVGNVDWDIGRHTGRYSGRQSVDSRSMVGRQSVDGRSIVGRWSVDSRLMVGR